MTVLDDFRIRDYDDAEIERLATLGFTPDSDPCVLVDGPHLELCFQRVDIESATKNPLHFDISTDDRRIEVERLIGLGAHVHEEFETHTWMLDPEGNDFCVTDRS